MVQKDEDIERGQAEGRRAPELEVSRSYGDTRNSYGSEELGKEVTRHCCWTPTEDRTS